MYEFTPFDIMQQCNIKSMADCRHNHRYLDLLGNNNVTDMFETLDNQLIGELKIFRTDSGEYYGYYQNQDKCFRTSNKCSILYTSTPQETYADDCYIEKCNGVTAIFNKDVHITFLDTLTLSDRYAPLGMRRNIEDKCWYQTPLMKYIAKSNIKTLTEFMETSFTELCNVAGINGEQLDMLCGINAQKVTVVDTGNSWLIHDARKDLDINISKDYHTMYRYWRPDGKTVAVFDATNLPRTWIESFRGFRAVCWFNYVSVVWHDDALIVDDVD